MGYTTVFNGEIAISPPLSKEEIDFINGFSNSRRMARTKGPYYIGGGDFGQDHDADIIDYNQPPECQPGLWCQWVVNDVGNVIHWDGGEKFYHATEWMEYIIDHFIGDGPIAKIVDPNLGFLQGHETNGVIYATGEDDDDHWLITVDNGLVRKRIGKIVYE